MNPPPPSSFPAHLDSLSLIRDYVRAAAAAFSLEKTRAYQLMLAVDEIATNILVHGFEGREPGGEVGISCTGVDGVLRIVLEDSGAPFDPRSMTLPGEEDLARPLEDRPMGGLGIYLAFQGVDRFGYQHRDGKNINQFEVDLQPKA